MLLCDKKQHTNGIGQLDRKGAPGVGEEINKGRRFEGVNEKVCNASYGITSNNDDILNSN